MPSLSAEQLSVLQSHADAGDRIAYHTSLGAFGFAYGKLALGMVLNNTVSGAAANSFFGSDRRAGGKCFRGPAGDNQPRPDACRPYRAYSRRRCGSGC